MTKEEIIAKIQQRRRQILVHSYIYYVLDENIIDDHTWTRWASELKELQDTYPELAAQAPLADDFMCFDPCTGHNLNLNQAWIRNKAHQLLGDY